MLKMPVGPGAGRRRRLLILACLAVSVVALAGCLAKSGTYAPVDWAYEMHYAPSYRAQESPRLLSPEGAVPTTGREVVYTSEVYATMPNPVARTAESTAKGTELYRVNCSFCHGPIGMGDGDVGKLLGAPDITGEPSVSRPPGQLFELISQGGQFETKVGMPRFRSLLSVDDRWLLVDYVLALQGR